MSSNVVDVPAPGYPIGVVSRLTKIHAETLRVWERRYGLVRPQRTERGGGCTARKIFSGCLWLNSWLTRAIP